MRLTLFLLSRKGPNGHIFRGKNRLVRPVTNADCHKLKREYEVEEKNMFYLRHPYITIEQSKGHARALGKKEAWLDNFRKIRTPVKGPVTLEQLYGHLGHNKSWE
ncbi:hypothetical protein L9F63_010982 [Diploptera punctata]|uniref:Ribosomal protein 63, mitochondrial n=1 Tax=Diploptera punctata TaxID=6984 RepID=A0AAD8EQG0_DIPPU|nr:hypothetical protein L9F63_010982 [Diploptera punctata]